MVRSYYVVASLALALTVQAGPIFQRQEADAETDLIIEDVTSTLELEPDSTIEDVTSTFDSESPDVPEIDVPTDTTSEAIPLETFPPKVCDHKPTDTSSWSDSGAAQMVDEWIGEKSSSTWLQSLTSSVLGNSATMQCGDISSNLCFAGEVPSCDDEDKYKLYFVRVMAAQIHSNFRRLHEKLQNEVIRAGLNVAQVVNDFKLPEPKESEVGKQLNNMAIFPTVMSAIVSMHPAGAVGAGIFSLFGAAISAGASNVEETKAEIPGYGEVVAGMNKRIVSFFDLTDDKLEKSLLAIFGEGENDDLVRDMVDKMKQAGLDVNKDASNPISEVMKGGEWLKPVQQNDVGKAMENSFRLLQQAIIGNLLATYQVYVEEEMPAYQEGAVDCGNALGTLLIDNSCYVIKHRDPTASSSKKAERLNDDWLQKMGEYGIDLHTLIRNVRECNNGEPDNGEIRTDGSLPKCFFGMRFAQRVNDKDYQFQFKLDGVVGSKNCLSHYKNPASLPEWLEKEGTDRCTRAIPDWKPCKVTFTEETVFTEGGLDRYRIGMQGSDVDISQICPFVFDNSGVRCTFGSNKQCYNTNQDGKYFADINFPKGSHGHGKYIECFNSLKNDFANYNRCESTGNRR